MTRKIIVIHFDIMFIVFSKRKANDLEGDLLGLKRMGDDALTEIELLKKDCQRKGDINHGLRLDIKDKEKELKMLDDEIGLAQDDGKAIDQ